MRCFPVLLLSFLWLPLTMSAAPTTIFDNTGGSPTLEPFIGGSDGQEEIEGFTWTQTVSYQNVSIAVSVRSIDQNHPNVTAYLTNAIGSTATAANNLIASATVNVLNFSATPIYPLVTFLPACRFQQARTT